MADRPLPSTAAAAGTRAPPAAAAPGFLARHRAWLGRLGIVDRPWVILGSAPEPTLPRALSATHARVDINNSGRTAAALGLSRADLTMRAEKKSWDEHRHLDTRGLLWVHSRPWLVARLLLAAKPHDHVGSLMTIGREGRDRIVAQVAGAEVAAVGDLGKVTNGVAAACYGLALGMPQVVLAGISLSKLGHSYDELGRERKQVSEDAFILSRLKDDQRLWTSEPDLARDAGLRLWREESG